MEKPSKVLAQGLPEGVPKSFRALANHSDVPRRLREAKKAEKEAKEAAKEAEEVASAKAEAEEATAGKKKVQQNNSGA